MQAEYKAYQPITNIKETTQIGVNALSQQQQAVQNENNARQQRLKELINAPLEAGQSIQNIFDSQESAILKNYEFSEGIEKNNFLDQIEKIDLDNSIPAIEKANRKQALSDGYKQARQIRRDNLKANNNFLLGKSQMDLAKYDEMDKMFFNSLENEFAKNRIALENQEKTQNRENVIKGLSSLSSPQSVYRNLDTIIKDINSDPTLAPIQKKGLIKEAGAKADKAAFDLRKANFLNTAYQGNPELGLQATRNEIGKLQNERYQPNLQNRGERIEELLNLEYKIQGMLNKQNNIKVVDNLNVSITESGETIQLKIVKI